MRRTATCLAAVAVAVVLLVPPLCAEEEGKLRIIAFGAHPDDNELRLGGTAILWARLGHKVKFVSVTNGDIGHHKMAGGPLAQRRTAEVKRAAEVMGIESEVLDIHDGELMPTLENRKIFVRLIRRWKADIVFAHRPYDYHPDHRYTGMLVQDAAYMVTVPYFCPDVPALEKNPVFMYTYDRFQKPYPFEPDVIVSIDKVFETKLRALAQIESQFLDWWQRRKPIDLSDPDVRWQTIQRLFRNRDRRLVTSYPDLLKTYYGDKAKDVQRAEAFEVCEYGRRPSPDELRKLFPIEASLE